MVAPMTCCRYLTSVSLRSFRARRSGASCAMRSGSRLSLASRCPSCSKKSSAGSRSQAMIVAKPSVSGLPRELVLLTRGV